jgi:hypothetical protein
MPNSEQCLLLPDGSRIPFSKHVIHYTIQPCMTVHGTKPIARVTKSIKFNNGRALAVLDTTSPDIWHARFGHYGIA